MFWKIFFVNAAIIIILFLTLSITTEQVLSKYSEDQYKKITENTTSRLNNQVSNLVLELNQLTYFVKKELLVLNENPEELDLFLKNVVEISRYIDGGTILNSNGDVLGNYPNDLNNVTNLIKRDYVQQALRSKQTTVSETINVNNREIIVMSVPLISNGNVHRIINLSIHLNSNTLINSMFEELEITDGSYAYITDENGNILFHPNRNQVMQDASLDFITEVVIHGPSNYEKLSNENGEAFYVSAEAIPALNWNIITVVSENSTLLVSKELRKILIPTFIILAVVVFITITIMMHNNLKPFTKLHFAINRVSTGGRIPVVKGADKDTEIGNIIGAFNVMVDELQEYRETIRQKTKELKQQRNFLNRLINHNPNAIYAMNWSGEYTMVNKEYANLFNLNPEDFIGKKEEEINPNQEDIEKYLRINREVMKSGKEREMEDYFLDNDGKKRWFHIGKVPIIDEGAETIVLTVATDITDRKKQEEMIIHQANHDELTSLPNRKLFKELLEMEVDKAIKNNYLFAVLFLDLDRFKYINDTYGHRAGDALLKMVSDRLSNCHNKKFQVFRLGGDEFTIIVPSINKRQEVAELSKEIILDLSYPYDFEDNKFIITASIGISIFPNNGEDAESLTKHADIAMYKAKEQGKNTFRFYTLDMETELASKLRLEMDLYQALDKEELFIQYQPLIDTPTGNVSGMEALLRWEHPKLGLISPANFIPIAEETGLIHSIGEWVLREACRQAKELNDQLDHALKLSVNISPVQLKDRNLVLSIKEILQDTGLDPEYLELEITESTIMENKREVVKVLKQLRSLGIRIAMDDFGTGYSSLNVLKKLPIDTLKIDRSIVHHLLDKDEGDEDVILRAVFDIAEKMKLMVIAEGIETNEQFDYLKDKYCHQVQGFLFSQPLIMENFVQYIKEKTV